LKPKINLLSNFKLPLTPSQIHIFFHALLGLFHVVAKESDELSSVPEQNIYCIYSGCAGDIG